MLNSAQPSGVEPMQAAIQATLTTIRNRARFYRNLVVCVSAVLIVSLILAAVFRSVIPLMGLSLLVPLAGTYFVLDNRLTRLWSKQILELWAEGKLNLTAFSSVISAHPYVPPATLEGMLGVLPDCSANNADKKASIAGVQELLRSHERRTVFASAGLFLTVLLLSASIVFRSGLLLASFVASALIWATLKRMWPTFFDTALAPNLRPVNDSLQVASNPARPMGQGPGFTPPGADAT
jgi:hypothetical protein